MRATIKGMKLPLGPTQVSPESPHPSPIGADGTTDGATGLERFFTTMSPTCWSLVALALALIHHADHVLRHDHSGWPFIADVTPFTFSLLVYPMIASILWARHRPRYQAWASALGLGLVLAAHTLIETPTSQFGTWASGVGEQGAPNLLEVSSPFLGIASVAIASALHLAVTLAMAGYIWKARLLRRRTQTASQQWASTVPSPAISRTEP